MNYSSIFSNAHAQAKATRHLFNTYRAAFSWSLSNEMKAEWLKIRLSAKAIKREILSLSGAFISNVAAKAMNADFECVSLLKSNRVSITLQNSTGSNLILSIYNGKSVVKHDVVGLDDTKIVLNLFAASI